MAAAILDNFEWPYLRNGSRSTYIARIARHLCDSTAFLFTFLTFFILSTFFMLNTFIEIKFHQELREALSETTETNY